MYSGKALFRSDCMRLKITAQYVDVCLYIYIHRVMAGSLAFQNNIFSPTSSYI